MMLEKLDYIDDYFAWLDCTTSRRMNEIIKVYNHCKKECSMQCIHIRVYNVKFRVGKKKYCMCNFQEILTCYFTEGSMEPLD